MARAENAAEAATGAAGSTALNEAAASSAAAESVQAALEDAIREAAMLHAVHEETCGVVPTFVESMAAAQGTAEEVQLAMREVLKVHVAAEVVRNEVDGGLADALDCAQRETERTAEAAARMAMDQLHRNPVEEIVPRPVTAASVSAAVSAESRDKTAGQDAESSQMQWAAGQDADTGGEPAAWMNVDDQTRFASALESATLELFIFASENGFSEHELRLQCARLLREIWTRFGWDASALASAGVEKLPTELFNDLQSKGVVCAFDSRIDESCMELQCGMAIWRHLLSMDSMLQAHAN